MVTNFDYLNHFWMMKMSNKMKIDGIIFKGLVLSFFNKEGLKSGSQQRRVEIEPAWNIGGKIRVAHW